MRILQIAVIEDNPADFILLRCVTEEIGLNCSLALATDGEEGVDCLLHRKKFENCHPADLILLDMHLPKLDGLEILKRVPGSATLPICMLTSSEFERPLVEAHFGRPVDYLVKPVTGEKLLCCLHRLGHLRSVADELIAPRA